MTIRRVARKEGKRGRHRVRRLRIRRKVHGTSERPRLSVCRTLAHIYAQVVDDDAGRTLAFASSREKNVPAGTKTERAAWVGRAVAERAKAAGIEKVVFDRGGRKYHGRVRALAEAAREAGLSF